MKRLSRPGVVIVCLGLLTFTLSHSKSRQAEPRGDAPATVVNTPLPVQGTANANVSGAVTISNRADSPVPVQIASGEPFQTRVEVLKASGQSENGRKNRIVGVWDIQVTIRDCAIGATLFDGEAIHKYELGGTGLVIPAGKPSLASPRVSVLKQVG